MLTFFTTAKSFVGHDGIIQRNALKSWTVLDPDVEVILFGDDEGAADISAELGLRHEPHVARHESGAKYLNSIFNRAREIATNDYLCFSNCDIVLTEDFRFAFERARAWSRKFLLVAQRWDLDVTEAIDFSKPSAAAALRTLAIKAGFRQDENWIDFFLFHREQYAGMPRLIVGHCYWDNWMIWRALADGVDVLDATNFVVPIHQNHGYNPKFGRSKGIPTDTLSLANLEAIGGTQHLRRIDAATHRFSASGDIRKTVLPNTYALRSGFRNLHEAWTYKVWLPVWHGFLGKTRPMRAAIGLRSKEKSNG
jgi:hypothetical protein